MTMRLATEGEALVSVARQLLDLSDEGIQHFFGIDESEFEALTRESDENLELAMRRNRHHRKMAHHLDANFGLSQTPELRVMALHYTGSASILNRIRRYVELALSEIEKKSVANLHLRQTLRPYYQDDLVDHIVIALGRHGIGLEQFQDAQNQTVLFEIIKTVIENTCYMNRFLAIHVLSIVKSYQRTDTIQAEMALIELMSKLHTIATTKLSEKPLYYNFGLRPNTLDYDAIVSEVLKLRDLLSRLKVQLDVNVLDVFIKPANSLAEVYTHQ